MKCWKLQNHTSECIQHDCQRVSETREGFDVLYQVAGSHLMQYLAAPLQRQTQVIS